MDSNQKNGAEEIETDTVLDESQDGNKSNEENAAMEKDTIKKDGTNTQLETPDISKELKSVPVDEKKNGEMSGDPPKKKYRADKQKLNAASKAKMTAAKSKATRKGTKEDVAESKAKKRQIAQKPKGRNGKGNNAKKKKDDTTSGKDAMTMEQVKKSLHAARNLVTKPSSNVCYKYSLCFGHCERNIFLLRCVTTWRAQAYSTGWKAGKRDFPDDSAKWTESGCQEREKRLKFLRAKKVKAAMEFELKK